jgi:hypothetical protein
MTMTALNKPSESRDKATQLVYNEGSETFSPVRAAQYQVDQLWAVLREENTADAYQQAGAKTWKLFKHLVALLLYVWLLLLAIVIWIWGIGFQSGYYFRKWISDEEPTSVEIVTACLKVLLLPFAWAYAWASEFVHSQLGWKNPLEEETADTPSVTETTEE